MPGYRFLWASTGSAVRLARCMPPTTSTSKKKALLEGQTMYLIESNGKCANLGGMGTRHAGGSNIQAPFFQTYIEPSVHQFLTAKLPRR